MGVVSYFEDKAIAEGEKKAKKIAIEGVEIFLLLGIAGFVIYKIL